MLSAYFDPRGRRVRALRDSPSGALFEGFAHALLRAGYPPSTARKHLASAEHFLHWTTQRRWSVAELNERSLTRFDHHLGRCRCQFRHADRTNVLYGARLFLRVLREAGTIATSVMNEAPPDPALLRAFCQWMREQRGTCETTLSNYARPIRALLARLGEAPGQFDARSLRRFVLERSRASGWAAAKTCTTALRMFVRFLIANGHCAVGLDAAIPTLAHWRLAALPRYLQPDDVERVIDSCDRTSPVGRRNRAMLLLLARLGLRADDIRQLRLRDIDWHGAWIVVSGKSRRTTRLPLSQEVGDALVSYLREGRPAAQTDRVFVGCRAPFRALARGVVPLIVGRTLHRAGVARPSRGAAHLLRHSVATSMLRHGASLQDIATLLRHQSIETTQIYAKVDVLALRQIAQPWPEVSTC
jgi:site-specific recombinase XerD